MATNQGRIQASDVAEYRSMQRRVGVIVQIVGEALGVQIGSKADVFINGDGTDESPLRSVTINTQSGARYLVEVTEI